MPINYKDYPANWNEIRERILERARHRCEDCGAPNRSFIKKSDREPVRGGEYAMYKNLIQRDHSKQQALQIMGFTEIVLTIAHLDHDKENEHVSDDRLKALCQRCHLKYDLPRHIENRKYGRNFRKNQKKLF